MAETEKTYGYWRRGYKSHYLYHWEDGRCCETGGTRYSFSYRNERDQTSGRDILKVSHQAAVDTDRQLGELTDRFVNIILDLSKKLEDTADNLIITPGTYVLTLYSNFHRYGINSIEVGYFSEHREKSDHLRCTFFPYLHIEHDSTPIWRATDKSVRISENVFNELKGLWDDTLEQCWDIVVRNCSEAIIDEEPDFTDPHIMAPEDQDRLRRYRPQIQTSSTKSSIAFFVKHLHNLRFDEVEHEMELVYNIRYSPTLLEIEDLEESNEGGHFNEYRLGRPADIGRETILKIFDNYIEGMGRFQTFCENSFSDDTLEPIRPEELKKGQFVCVADRQFRGYDRFQICKISKIEKANDHFYDIRGELISYNGKRLQMLKSSTLEVRIGKALKVPADLYEETKVLAHEILNGFKSSTDAYIL